MTPSPTLDDHRTDQLRTFLVTEAAADLAGAPSTAPARRWAPRLAVGVAAAVLLGGLLAAGTSAVDAPGGRPTRADALSFETTDDGWTTIRIADIDADPDAVVAELRAAGFEARREVLQVDRTTGPDGQETVGITGPGDGPGSGGMAVMSVGASTSGDRGLAGLSVEVGEGTGTRIGSADQSITWTPNEWADGDVRFGIAEDQSVSIRNGADVTLVVLTEAP